MKPIFGNPVAQIQFDMKKSIVKVVMILVIFELIFLMTLKSLLAFIPHEEHEFIYYFNINLLYLISIIIWITYPLSKVDNLLIMLIGLWFSISTPYSIFFIFSKPNFSDLFNYINFHILYIFSTTYQLIITLFIFILSLKPRQKKYKILVFSFIFGILISVLNYSPMFLSGEYRSSWEPLFSKSYNLHILNFSLLVIFWHQYTKAKIIFSEYLSNVISVYTIIIGLEIFHNFSAQNELLFHYFAQYFNSILYLVILVLFFARWLYLLNPESEKNEKYVKNYYLMQGLVDKPRRGLLIEFYSGINRTTLYSAIGLLLFLGIFLFLFDKFKIFIRLNLLLLLIAIIVSGILSIITWHKRWYDAIGIFFKIKNRK